MTSHVPESHVTGGREQLTYALQGGVQKGLGGTSGPGTKVYNKLRISYEDRYQPVRRCPPQCEQTADRVLQCSQLSSIVGRIIAAMIHRVGCQQVTLRIPNKEPTRPEMRLCPTVKVDSPMPRRNSPCGTPSRLFQYNRLMRHCGCG